MLSKVMIISCSVLMSEASMQSSDVFRPQKKLPVEKSKKKNLLCWAKTQHVFGRLSKQ